MNAIKTHKELRVWQDAMDSAMRIFEESKKFPAEERYSLVDQIRRSSRSVAANISEAWRRRRYEASFINKLNESESEAAETQTWIEFARRCGYMDFATCDDLDQMYDRIIGQIVVMMNDSTKWTLEPIRSHSPGPQVPASPNHGIGSR
jgi:four helix bundle protein